MDKVKRKHFPNSPIEDTIFCYVASRIFSVPVYCCCCLSRIALMYNVVLKSTYMKMVSEILAMQYAESLWQHRRITHHRQYNMFLVDTETRNAKLQNNKLHPKVQHLTTLQAGYTFFALHWLVYLILYCSCFVEYMSHWLHGLFISNSVFFDCIMILFLLISSHTIGKKV